MTLITASGLPHIYLYDSRSFLNVGPAQIKPFMEIPAMTPPGVVIKEIAWNPVVPAILVVVFSNGSLALYMVKVDGSKYDTTTLPPGEGVTCISWSPKGKQLVVGTYLTAN